MYYLKLTLAGVLQSWGTSDTFWPTFRDTELIPTTSALIGLISCALGISETDPIHDRVSNCHFFCERIDKTEKLLDYQIVSPREYKYTIKDSKFWTMDGGHSKPQFIMHKGYLTNSEFIVYVGYEDKEFLHTIYKAFLNPKYSYFLGRACCTPSKPIVDREFTVKSKLDEEEVIPCIYTL